MAAQGRPTIHASAVLAGARAVLIRGPAGAGKSSLALALVEAANVGHLSFARLVADDRAEVEAVHGRLLVRPSPRLAGLIEIRGLGIRHLPFEPVAVVGLVADLAVKATERLPGPADLRVAIAGITLRRLPVGIGSDPFRLVIAALRESDSGP
jgi:HPr kinase/phosphorylase